MMFKYKVQSIKYKVKSIGKCRIALYSVLGTLYFFFSIPQLLSAQAALKGTVQPDQYVYWLTFFKTKWEVNDSTKSDKDGNFHFTNVGKMHGLYKIKSSDIEQVFVWAGEETTVKSTVKDGLPGFIISSHENDIYAELNVLNKKWKDSLSVIQSGYSLIDNFHPFYKTKSDSIDHIILSAAEKFNKQIKSFQDKNKGTLVADVLAPMYTNSLWIKSSPDYKKFDNANSYAHYHYFDGLNDIVPLKAKITAGDLLYNKIMDYYTGYTIKSIEGFKNSSDLVLKSFEIRKDVRNLLLENMASIFEKKGPPDVFVYLSDTYLSKCEVEDDFKDWIQRAELIKKLAAGNPAPELTMMTADSQQVKLSSLKGKKVLIYFWASWCAHCRDEVPKMIQVYNHLKDKNFEIYGVSLDENPAEWKTFSNEKHIPWINVCDFKKWKSDAALAYDIKGTPNSYLIDEKGIIIGREITPARLEDMILGN